MAEDVFQWREAIICQCFSPGTPINEKNLFAGRLPQVGQAIDAVFQRGVHAIVFGERGVGKTSFVNCFAKFLLPKDDDETFRTVPIRVHCTSESTFETIWREVYSKISITRSVDGAGFVPSSTEQEVVLEPLPDAFEPSIVQHILDIVSRHALYIIAIDEFDQITDRRTKRLMADTIKALSDSGTNTTVLLVGIGDTVDDLIAEHQSVARCLKQIPMPRMSLAETSDIMQRGIAKYNGFCPNFQIQASDEALELIGTLSRGMPHYAHLLALHACISAIRKSDALITPGHVLSGTKDALAGVTQYVVSAFVKATTSSHANALYKDVLAAAALASTDALGFFPPNAVKKPLQAIVQRKVEMSTYIKHLNDFCTPDRGSVLQRKGEAWKCRFRFQDPLMQPYVVIQALGEGKLNTEALRPAEFSSGGESVGTRGG